jgi:hypothetical protein
MSVEANKAIVRRFIDEILNEGDVAVIDEIVEDWVEHDMLGLLQQMGAIPPMG